MDHGSSYGKALIYCFTNDSRFGRRILYITYITARIIIIIRPPTGPRSGPGCAIHVMMGDNREGWFAKPCEPGRSWTLMMHSGRELFDKSKRLIVKRKLIYLS